MKRTLFAALTFATLALAAPHAHADHSHGKTASKLKLENLMRSQLGRVSGTEVIVSRVTLPPGAVLPTHWHPGEEFAYVLDGSVTIHLKGKKSMVGRAGDVLKVPLKQVHSAKAGKRGATALVFRVHESGKPERVIVK
jgi:quercetin dioxygenase-like cupin family protein